MRIAICISGVPRGGHFTTWIKKIAERYETKIFVSYWLPHDDFLVHSNTPSIRTPYILDHATYQVDKAETFYSQHLWEDMKPVFQSISTTNIQRIFTRNFYLASFDLANMVFKTFQYFNIVTWSITMEKINILYFRILFQKQFRDI